MSPVNSDGTHMVDPVTKCCMSCGIAVNMDEANDIESAVEQFMTSMERMEA